MIAPPSDQQTGPRNRRGVISPRATAQLSIDINGTALEISLHVFCIPLPTYKLFFGRSVNQGQGPSIGPLRCAHGWLPFPCRVTRVESIFRRASPEQHRFPPSEEARQFGPTGNSHDGAYTIGLTATLQRLQKCTSCVAARVAGFFYAYLVFASQERVESIKRKAARFHHACAAVLRWPLAAWTAAPGPAAGSAFSACNSGDEARPSLGKRVEKA